MKNTFRKMLSLLASLAIIGSSCSSVPYKTEETTSVSEAELQNVAAIEMPVIYIDSLNGSSDFATKPVSRHVSEQIASWTPGYVIPPEPYYETCAISIKDGDGTSLLESAEAQVKARGNWTTNYDKKSFRLKFTEKQNLLGLNDGADVRNWVLLAEYKDASMLRNKTAFEISREILSEDGLYASDCALTEVYINGEYWGVYLLAELQQINNDRVDITKAEEGYTGTDIGYFLEFDGYYYNEDPLQRFHVDYAGNAPLTPYDGKGGSGRTITCLPTDAYDPCIDVGFTIVSDIYSEKQRDFIASYVNNVYNIMYEAAYNDKAYIFNSDYTAISETTEITPGEAVKNVVDIQSLVDMYIISELTCDADIYWSSFFMSADFGEDGNKKLTFTAPWDFDSALGNKNRCADGNGFYASNIVPDVNGGPRGGGQYESANPWLVVLAYEDWYQSMIRTKWTSIYDSGVFTRAYDMIETDKTQYSSAFTRNLNKWKSIDHDSFKSELSLNALRCKNQAEAADYLNRWLQSRVEFLNSQWHL